MRVTGEWQHIVCAGGCERTLRGERKCLWLYVHARPTLPQLSLHIYLYKHTSKERGREEMSVVRIVGVRVRGWWLQRSQHVVCVSVC